MRFWVYIDGFNLYNGALKSTCYKWLDLQAFCQKLLLPNDTIDKIKYFTASVNARVTDPNQQLRQKTYWRALLTIPCIEIIEGHFLSKKTWMPEASSVEHLAQLAALGQNVRGHRPNMLEVYRSEEKGSDVNLAAHLIHDAHLGRFDCAMVISNDSDFKESVKIVKQEIGKLVGIYVPRSQRPSAQLRSVASFFRTIPTSAIRDSQFPDQLTDSRGTFHKPSSW